MNIEPHTQRAQDLERRIRVYEQMEESHDWPGAMNAFDYIALTLMTLVLVIGFFVWGY